MGGVIFAYFGPETVLPLASVLATVLGVVMMFGRLSLRMMLAPFKWLGRKAKGPAPSSAMRGPTAWRKGGAADVRSEANAAGASEEA